MQLLVHPLPLYTGVDSHFSDDSGSSSWDTQPNDSSCILSHASLLSKQRPESNMKRPTFIAAFTLSLVARNNAQCVTPGYLLCMPAGSQLGGVPSDSFDDSAFWSSLQTVASLPIGRRALADGLVERQNSLCCSPDPDVECLVTKEDNIPFCYVSALRSFLLHWPVQRGLAKGFAEL